MYNQDVGHCIGLNAMKLWRFFAFMFFIVESYAATVNGISDKEILNLIKSQLSDWSDVSENSISSEFKLKKDRKVIKQILMSYGYCDAKVLAKLKNNNAIFNIALNERYKFDEVLLKYTDQENYRTGLKIKQVFDLIGIGYDTYTDTKQLADGGDKIADFFKNKGFAFVKVPPPKVKCDKKTKKIKAIYEIELNGKVIIDKTILNIKSKKDPKLLEPFVRNRISWKDGDVYDRQKIDDMKNDLMSSRIFSGISVALSQPHKDAKDKSIVHAILTIDIEEALLRDISAGLKYGTSEKFGILLSWTHYNVNGKGASLSANMDVSKHNRYISLRYDTPDFFYKKQQLSNKVFYKKEKEEAYDVLKSGAESMLWQTFGTKFHAGIGLCVEDSETYDKIQKEDVNFSAVGIPIGLKFDTTNEYLDPQQGIRCQAMLLPYMSHKNNITIFTGKASIYIPFRKNEFQNNVVLAIYSKYGAILKNKRHKTPRDKLFFAGGSGSVRGYGYQKLGDFSEINDKNKDIIKSDGKPLGGESLFEIGVEPRFRVSENFGVVCFVEGGNVFPKKMTNPLKKLMIGYGFGVRFYNAYAPIRIDVAFPTKIRKTKRGKKIDSLFNLYISVGQAF